MTETLFWEKFQQLPAPSREAVIKFIDFLLSEAQRPTDSSKTVQRTGYGSWKGIRLSPDFDAPLSQS